VTWKREGKDGKEGVRRPFMYVVFSFIPLYSWFLHSLVFSNFVRRFPASTAHHLPNQ